MYHNVGMAPAVGKEASVAMIQGFLDMAETMTFDIHRIAADGDSVLTERTDTFTINGLTRRSRSWAPSTCATGRSSPGATTSTWV